MAIRRNWWRDTPRLVVLLTLLMALLLAVPLALQHRLGRAVPAPAAHDVGYGISMGSAIYGRPEAVAQQFQKVAASGATWVRVDFDWSLVEAVRGRFDWSRLDRLSALAAANRLQVLGVLTFAPAWAREPGTSTHGSPTDVAAFSRFAAAAAARYAPRGVRTWEVWNEPNLSTFWEPLPDPARYGRLLAAAAAALHVADPEARVLSGGLAPVDQSGDPERIPPESFLDSLYDSGAMVDVDAVADHPYSFPARPTGQGSAFRELAELRQVMVEHGGEKGDLWLTEFGSPTGSGLGAVSEKTQALILTNGCAEARGQPWIRALFVYQLYDSGTNQADIEQNFGLLEAGGSPKLAWSAWTHCRG